MKKIPLTSKVKSGIAAHKILSSVIAVTVIIGGIGIYRSAKTANTGTRYVLAPAHIGTLTQTVSGTGQVSATNQTDVKSQVSGTITSVKGAVGQKVRAGDLIATIDSTQAALDLENARLALEKLQEPPKDTELSNAQNAVSKAYADGFNAAANTFLDMSSVMDGLKNLLYSRAGFLSDQYSTNFAQSTRDYLTTASRDYDRAVDEYGKVLIEYRGVTRASPQADVSRLLEDTYALSKNVANVLQETHNALTRIITTQPDYNPSAATSAQSDVTSWSTKINADVSGIVNAQNGIDTANNSLKTLTRGADALDIRSQELTLRQKQQAYADYFITAPFDGVIGRIPVNVYDQASGGTVIATVIGLRKSVTVSLNEIDAAKVLADQQASLTFDAAQGLVATGTVSEIDLVGTMTQGVVNYNAKVAINSDDARMKPGMSTNVTIVTDHKEGALLVPSAAVKTQGNIHYVQILDSASASQPGQSNGTSSTRIRMTTVASSIPPHQQIVTTGDSDDTNTEIVSGLNPGQLVVVRTVSGTAAQTASAPSILGNFGTSGRGGAAGGVRTGAGGGR